MGIGLGDSVESGTVDGGRTEEARQRALDSGLSRSSMCCGAEEGEEGGSGTHVLSKGKKGLRT